MRKPTKSLLMMFILFFIKLVAGDGGKMSFKWDVGSLEDVFCETSLQLFNKKHEKIEKLIQAKEVANQFLKSELKMGRRKMAIWPWEYQDSFEGECIEEKCETSEIKEFCSRRSKNLYDRTKNEKLTEHRNNLYTFCRKHVKKTVDNIKSPTKTKKPEEGAPKNRTWKDELTPDRLFRGWWEEMFKSYTRFCLKDKTDCARRCDVDHGTCRLYQDLVERNETEQWKYRCICDPGFGPKLSGNYADQYLCNKKIDDIASGNQCAPLQVQIEESDELINVPVDHKYLCDALEPGWDCESESSTRKRRIAGTKGSKDADSSYFPSAVDIFECSNAACTHHKRRAIHRCGGTLITLGAELGSQTNLVVTAAHCFCELNRDFMHVKKDIQTPKAEHYIIRIGIINNKQLFNIVNPTDINGKQFYKMKSEKLYIDVTVKSIKLKDEEYIGSCGTPTLNGENDLAVIILNGIVDVKNQTINLSHHVKPACPSTSLGGNLTDLLIGNNRCFAAGWGNSNTDGYLSLSESLKFTQVEIVHQDECINAGWGDTFLTDLKEAGTEEKIICAKGWRDANTCGGDSGGGLYCYDKKGENYYFMGPLHGGGKCEDDSLMYYSNLKYKEYSEWLDDMKTDAAKHVTKIKDEL